MKRSLRPPAGPRFGIIWWWDLSALARGISIAALLVPALIEPREGPFGPWVCVFLALWANKSFAVIETCASLGLAVRAFVRRAQLEMRRHLFSAVVRAFFGMLPVFVFQTGVRLQLQDRVYLSRHLQELQAVVNGADPEQFGYMDVYREPRWTVIQAVNVSTADCYWIIYSEDVYPSEEATPAGGSVLHGRLWKVEHIWGPWYSLVS